MSQAHGVLDMAPACQFCDSVEAELRKGTMAFASKSVWEKAAPPPSSHCDARQFSSSFYISDGFQSAAIVLELRGSES